MLNEWSLGLIGDVSGQRPEYEVDEPVCLVKTSCTRKINDFQRACSQVLR
jgi:hypothetical protein